MNAQKDITGSTSAVPSVATQTAVAIPGQPQEQLEIEESGSSQDEVVYPTGAKLWLNVGSFMVVNFVRSIDITIVAVAVPSLTNEFKSINDIGWYNAAFMVTGSATILFFGKLYTLFSPKSLYLTSIVISWVGCLICTFAKTSKVFILGRAIAGLGNACQGAGLITLLNMMFPLAKQPKWYGMINFVGSAGLVSGPLVGGLLIEAFNWRACFGINIPLNAICLAIAAYSVQNNINNPDTELPIREKLKRLDLRGSLVFVPALTFLLMGLTWGGAKYGWKDPRIIVLFVLSVVLLTLFAYLQHRSGDEATVPPRIAMQRSILAGALFCMCCDGTLAVTENYLSVYFQGIKGVSPAKSGLLGLPMIAGLMAASLLYGWGTTYIGYYTPFMVATSVLAPIGSGLLTTLDLDSQLGKAAGLMGLLGFGLGLGMQAPLTAVTATLRPKEVSIGGAILGFGAGMGSAVFSSATAVLFQGRLRDEISRSAPGTNVTTIEHAGLSDIRRTIGPDRLKYVLVGYDKAVIQTLYIPLGLTLLTILGTGLTEWRSIKKKQA
ncbi:hypothetical protein LTR64_002700 [Lithohypha guttulata]|uniref:uncharacterized protein n=1 Tax=Lithohypha guttulata TaxID=1690604 RepID=UPI002DDE3B4D|nr:hypothetical protein LTR51_001076 [Lithohypha guttulata]